MTNPRDLKTGETVRHRLDGEALTVVESNGCVVVIRDAAGDVYPVAIGLVCRAVDA